MHKFRAIKFPLLNLILYNSQSLFALTETSKPASNACTVITYYVFFSQKFKSYFNFFLPADRVSSIVPIDHD